MSVAMALLGLISVSQAESPFRELDEPGWLNSRYRGYDGRPTREYWQQEVDYKLDVSLDIASIRVHGKGRIEYTNRSPESLSELWLHLDAEAFDAASIARQSETVTEKDEWPIELLQRRKRLESDRPGIKLSSFSSADGSDSSYKVFGTKLRVDLENPVEPDSTRIFAVEWSFDVPHMSLDGRGGFRELGDGTELLQVTQWYPRVAAYTDYGGWRIDDFLREGEITSEIGDFDVSITVPEHFTVAGTGVLLNSIEVLTAEQQRRFAKLHEGLGPLFIVTPEEARNNRSTHRTSPGKRVSSWRFDARQVRDFAWAASPSFAWRATSLPIAGKQVNLYAFYPDEASEPWKGSSLDVMAHGLTNYTEWLAPYPYPNLQLVGGGVAGMEYPMMALVNDGDAEPNSSDGVVVDGGKIPQHLLWLTLHEIGHMFFPIVVNSDERVWGWMDEGLTSHIDYRAMLAWDRDLQGLPASPHEVGKFMRDAEQLPLMTAHDYAVNSFEVTYHKAGAALTVLRDAVLGAEVFDRAFASYVNAWQFRRPTPYDFFRHMEYASGRNLDWFWRAWFFETNHVDIEMSSVERIEFERGTRIVGDTAAPAGETRVECAANDETANFYRVGLKNVGGIVSPVLLRLEFDEAGFEDLRYPAEIWRKNPDATFVLVKTVESVNAVVLDPERHTADADVERHRYPGPFPTTSVCLTEPQ